MYQLAPSILSADFSCLGDAVWQIEKAGADLVHIDVMDGRFVPSISFGMPVIKAIRPFTKLPFDVHLMIENPEQYIIQFRECGADIITVHAEACLHLQRTIMKIKETGAKACVSLNPATPLSVLDYILEDIDMILIMSVNPGFGGQKFIPQSIRKIKELKEKIHTVPNPVLIEVDGGITLENAEDIVRAGADVLVAGSAVFQNDIQAQIHAFQEVFTHVSA